MATCTSGRCTSTRFDDTRIQVKRHMPNIVFTGVSTGIGYATTEALLDRGYHVFGSVRRQEDADRLQAGWGEHFTPLLFDVTDEEAILHAAEHVAHIVGREGLAGLVNNAGIAVPGPVLQLLVDEYRRQFEINLFGQIAVIQAFLPLLGARKPCPHPPGRIVNISSVSGKIAYPFLSAYACSKYALEALSDSLRRELMLYGIDVIVVEPGAVSTPIWDKSEEIDTTPFEGSDYADIMTRMVKGLAKMGNNAQGPEAVTGVVIDALESRRPKTRYALPTSRLTGWWLPRYLPTRWFDRLVARRLGITSEY
jgi:NAD(P)-dependent dehydrogenase (short-subunit alcohol dehydrogenase family)